jgi:predicted HicB family RNase H-like nuclease
MMNQMTIDGVKAVITYDPELDLFRGEFVGLNGGADFYAADAEGLRREGAISHKVFMEACQEDGQEDGVEPFKAYSGKFVLSLNSEDHAAVSRAALASGKSLNQWAAEVLRQAAH